MFGGLVIKTQFCFTLQIDNQLVKLLLGWSKRRKRKKIIIKNSCLCLVCLNFKTTMQMERRREEKNCFSVVYGITFRLPNVSACWYINVSILLCILLFLPLFWDIFSFFQFGIFFFLSFRDYVTLNSTSLLFSLTLLHALLSNWFFLRNII